MLQKKYIKGVLISMLKKIIPAGLLPLIFLFCLFFIGSTSVSAAENNDHVHTQSELDNPNYLGVPPRYDACPEGGKHTMVGAGNGWVWSTKKKAYILTKGQASRCSKCSFVIVSQYNPFAGHSLLGNFATANGSTSQDGNIIYSNTLSYNSKLGGDDFTRSLIWRR